MKQLPWKPWLWFPWQPAGVSHKQKERYHCYLCRWPDPARCCIPQTEGPVGISRSLGPGGRGGPGCRSRSFAGSLRWVPSPLLAQAAAASAQARCGGCGHQPDAVGSTGSRFSCFRGLSFIAAGWVELGQAISLDAGL